MKKEITIKKILNKFAEKGTILQDRNMIFFKSHLFPSDIINRDVVKKCGDSKTFETYERVAHKKNSLVAYIKNKAKDYNLILVKGERTYFIFVKYDSKVFAKMFGIKNTIGLWELNKENYEWIKNSKHLKIQNKEEWEKFEALMVAKSLSEDK